MRIAVLDDYQGVALQMTDWSGVQKRAQVELFRDHLFDEAALAKRLAPFDIVVTMRERTPFPRSLLEQLPNLKLLLTTGMQNRSFDMDACAARKVQVCGTNAGGGPTADLAWALILGLARHIAVEDRVMREGGFQTTLGREMITSTLGVLGLGKLGQRVARIGKAFDMNIIAWSPNLTDERAVAGGAKRVSKEEFFAQADFISIHMVLSERSRGVVGAADLARMKKTAYIVNTSRGPLIDEQALIAALKERRIAGAGLDVYDIEPLPKDHPFRQMDNVLLSPHLGYVTEENYRSGYGQMVECIAGFLDGKLVRPLNQVK